MSLVDPREQSVKRTVALAGATGLVGRSILEGLLADPSVRSVHVLARRKPRVADARNHMPHRGFRGDAASSARR
jgi:uncharacterized protein YbjT (DUF2867 family)